MAEQLTDLEKEVLEAHLVIMCGIMGGESLEDCLSDSMSVTDAKELSAQANLALNTTKGVIGSLCKKGLQVADVGNQHITPRAELWLTEDGVRRAWAERENKG